MTGDFARSRAWRTSIVCLCATLVSFTPIAHADPSTQPTTQPLGAVDTVRQFFDHLRRRELERAKALCFSPAGTLDRDFGREMPAESEKMATGKREVAVVDGKESGDFAVVMFNEDLRAKEIGAKLEPLWLARRDAQWKVNVGDWRTFAETLTEAERAEVGQLRRWFSDRKQELVDASRRNEQ